MSSSPSGEPTGQPQVPSVLVVDDEPLVRDAVRRSLEAHFPVEEAGDGEEAVALLDRGEYPVVVVDLMMPRMDGIALLRWIQEHRPETRTVVLTGYASKDLAIDALNLRATRFIEKPWKGHDLEEAIESAWAEYYDLLGLPVPADVEHPPELAAVRRAIEQAKDLHDHE